MKDQPPLTFPVTPPVGLGRLRFQVQEGRQLPFDVYLQRLKVEGGVLTEVPMVLLQGRMLLHTNLPAERDVEIRGPF